MPGRHHNHSVLNHQTHMTSQHTSKFLKRLEGATGGAREQRRCMHLIHLHAGLVPVMPKSYDHHPVFFLDTTETLSDVSEDQTSAWQKHTRGCLCTEALVQDVTMATLGVVGECGRCHIAHGIAHRQDSLVNSKATVQVRQ